MRARLTRTHAVDSEGPLERVFALFTPRGEEEWAQGWKPTYVYPESGAIENGMVFLTGNGEERTIWACAAYEPASHRVRYARVTPASRFAFVEVVCEEIGPDRTRATVTYELTALTAGGSRYLEGLTAAAFEGMIDGWREAIHRSALRHVRGA